MRRALWICLALAMLGNLAVAGVVLRQMRYGSGVEADGQKKKWLVEIRKALFSDATGDVALLGGDPASLVAHGFAVDPPEDIAAWAKAELPRAPYLAGVDAASLPRDEIERTKAIALLFSKNGGPGCGAFVDLQDAVEHIADDKGFGCCADHAQVMIALGQAYGLAVRQVGHANHSFNEVWSPRLGKWIFVDPQYALMARDDAGNQIGLLEMRERMRAGLPVVYEFFGNDYHEFSRGDPSRHDYYKDFAALRDARFVWGSNVIAQDRLERRLAALPRAVRQMIGFTTGVFPKMMVLADDDASLPATYRKRRAAIYGIAGGLAAGTAIPALLLFTTRRRAR